MIYQRFSDADYGIFHELLNAYYREGEDENTTAETIDAFIDSLFKKVLAHEIEGCFLKSEDEHIGFALWAIDSKDFVFSEIIGAGTILEIGIVAKYRSRGYGKGLVSYIENYFSENGIKSLYVSAYGPAQKFWASCGYVKNGKTAKNGLPIMTKSIF